jgi:hypothetical protein
MQKEVEIGQKTLLDPLVKVSILVWHIFIHRRD